MNKLNRFVILGLTVFTGLVAAISQADATILDLPSYSQIFSTTSVEFGGYFIGDLVPWAGFLAVITIVGLALAAIVRRTLGGVKKITGGGRRGRGRRRR